MDQERENVLFFKSFFGFALIGFGFLNGGKFVQLILTSILKIGKIIFKSIDDQKMANN